jgi:uncharacterized protein (TIGR02271 family)
MTITTPHDVDDWIGREAFDPNGDPLGTIADLYVDDDSGQPTWLAVSQEAGTRISLIPLAGATAEGNSVVVAHDKATVKAAPQIEVDGEFSAEDEAILYRHYGYEGGADQPSRQSDGESGDSRGPSEDAMTRSEEELHVDKRKRETGRARLRKWVETENVQITVPVRREKARLVTEAITDSNRDAALSGPELSEDEHEVVLYDEEVVVEKRVVPKERVRLETEAVTDQVDVDEVVRKERIDFEGDDAVLPDADGSASR